MCVVWLNDFVIDGVVAIGDGLDVVVVPTSPKQNNASRDQEPRQKADSSVYDWAPSTSSRQRPTAPKKLTAPETNSRDIPATQ